MLPFPGVPLPDRHRRVSLPSRQRRRLPPPRHGGGRPPRQGGGGPGQVRGSQGGLRGEAEDAGGSGGDRVAFHTKAVLIS